MRSPAMAISTLVLPAATTPTRAVRIGPLLVSTPVTAPLAGSRRMPVTSQFWMMSTPSRLAARA